MHAIVLQCDGLSVCDYLNLYMYVNLNKLLLCSTDLNMSMLN